MFKYYCAIDEEVEEEETNRVSICTYNWTLVIMITIAYYMHTAIE